MTSYYGWQVYLEDYGRSHGGEISPSLATTYGKCYTPISQLMDRLRLKARTTIFDQHALEVQQIVAFADDLVVHRGTTRV
ncbi:MAG: hypothetical protein ACRDRT_09790 [Pseudonocardiaceae bacterium]